MYRCDQNRLKEKISVFRRFSEDETRGVTRLSLSKEALQAREELVKRCKDLGMEIRTDDMGNIYATLPGTEPGLPAILSGSHLDSVREGGNYDGTLGVLAALEALETMAREGISHRHPMTLAVWTNEEGARFDPCMMSSGVLTGKFSREEMLASKDPEGVTFGEALAASGYEGSARNRATAQNSRALVELHVEQGPVLWSEKKKIGAVEGVVGMVIYELTVSGQSDHAGTTPMQYRKDALYGAAKLLCWLHEKLDELDKKLVYTTGRVQAHPNIHTVIPDRVTFTLDARHQDEGVLAQVRSIVEAAPKEIEGCRVEKRLLWSRATVPFQKELVDMVEENAGKLGCSVKRMYSGAGHDAQYLAEMVPTTMIFVPSIEGHSHCKEEYTALEDCAKGVDVLLNTLLQMDREF